MTVSAAVFKENRYFSQLKESKYILISSFVLILGMFVGSVFVHILGVEQSETLKMFFSIFIKQKVNSSFIRLFLTSLISGLVYLLLICLSSFGVSGFPIIPVVLFIKGMLTCILSGFLYRNYSLQGIAFSNLILLPSDLLTNFILIHISSEGLKLCSKFYCIIKDVSARGIEIRSDLIKLLRIVVYSVILISIASLIEACFSVCFIKYFDFN